MNSGWTLQDVIMASQVPKDKYLFPTYSICAPPTARATDLVTGLIEFTLNV